MRREPLSKPDASLARIGQLAAAYVQAYRDSDAHLYALAQMLALELNRRRSRETTTVKDLTQSKD